jgi:hypothetical protein
VFEKNSLCLASLVRIVEYEELCPDWTLVLVPQEVVDAQQKKIETCETYGFEKGSEPFGQCIFKLMELDLEYAKLENEQLRLEAQAITCQNLGTLLS